jgi:hypothetical protein
MTALERLLKPLELGLKKGTAIAVTQGSTLVPVGALYSTAQLRDAFHASATALSATSNGIASPISPNFALPDAALPDAALPDAASPDAASPDAASPDAASPDAASPDAASPDTASPDTASPDATSPDAASPNIALPDAASPETLEFNLRGLGSLIDDEMHKLEEQACWPCPLSAHHSISFPAFLHSCGAHGVCVCVALACEPSNRALEHRVVSPALLLQPICDTSASSDSVLPCSLHRWWYYEERRRHWKCRHVPHPSPHHPISITCTAPFGLPTGFADTRISHLIKQVTRGIKGVVGIVALGFSPSNRIFKHASARNCATHCSHVTMCPHMPCCLHCPLTLFCRLKKASARTTTCVASSNSRMGISKLEM